jgi:hypothetical protein
MGTDKGNIRRAKRKTKQRTKRRTKRRTKQRTKRRTKRKTKQRTKRRTKRRRTQNGGRGDFFPNGPVRKIKPSEEEKLASAKHYAQLLIVPLRLNQLYDRSLMKWWELLGNRMDIGENVLDAFDTFDDNDYRSTRKAVDWEVYIERRNAHAAAAQERQDTARRRREAEAARERENSPWPGSTPPDPNDGTFSNVVPPDPNAPPMFGRSRMNDPTYTFGQAVQ